MRYLIAILAICASQGAFAQAKACLPKSPWVPINLSGDQLMEGRDNTIKGDWAAIWCRSGTFDPVTGGEVWVLYTHAVLDKYRTVNSAALMDMAQSIIAADDPLGALNAALTAGRYVPPVGSQDRFDWETLLYTACTQGVALPPLPKMTVKNTCKAPTPITGTPVEVWKTPPAGTFTVYLLNGTKLGSAVPGVKALPNEVCSTTCALSGTSKFCSTPSIGPNRITYCVKAK